MGIFWTKDGDYEDDSPGHIYFIGLCKEADGTYTATQANGGVFALGGTDISKIHWHPLSNVSWSENFPCLIEFPSLTQEEASEFLLNAFKNDSLVCRDKMNAEYKYKGLFDPIIRKKNTERIPPRRGQITGNCSVRSLKELMIYSFQKENKIDLANKFFKYVDGRGSETLAFEEIKPFKEDF